MENYKDGDIKKSYTFIQANAADHMENTNGKKKKKIFRFNDFRICRKMQKLRDRKHSFDSR